MLVSIVATPLLLRWLGQERLGAFRATGDWGGYVALLELGLGGALPPMFAQAISCRDHLRTRQVMAVGLRAFRRVTLFMTLAGIIFVVALPSLVRVGPSLVGELRVSAIVACAAIFFTPLSPLRIFLEASQRSYVANAALLMQTLAISVLCLLFAWKGYGLTGQWLAVAFGAVVYQVIIFACVWRDVTDLPRLFLTLNPAMKIPLQTSREGLTAVDQALSAEMEANTSRQLWRLNGPTLVLNICGRVSYLTDNVVIAFFLGPAAVVPFLLTQRLSQIIQGQVSNIGNSTWAALAELHATGQHELFARRTIQLTQLVFVTGLAGMLPFLAFNRSFVIRWVGVGQYAGVHLMFLAVANGLLLSLVTFWSWPFIATQNIRMIVPPSLYGGLVNLTASILCTKLFGVTGPLWGTLISFMVVYVWWMPLLLRRAFAVPIRALLACLMKPTLLGAVYGLPLVWVGLRFPPHNWFMIASDMAIGGCGYLALAAIIVLDAEQRQTLNSRILKRFMPRSENTLA
jgi:O-antigen/teichoic acid export membrane protein